MFHVREGSRKAERSLEKRRAQKTNPVADFFGGFKKLLMRQLISGNGKENS